jgi:hypothetical protein
MNMLGGVKIIESPLATEEVYNFPLSKNRSKRLHKKLLKRYRAQTFRRPCAYMISGDLYAHPEIVMKMAEDNRVVKLTKFSL